MHTNILVSLNQSLRVIAVIIWWVRTKGHKTNKGILIMIYRNCIFTLQIMVILLISHHIPKARSAKLKCWGVLDNKLCIVSGSSIHWQSLWESLARPNTIKCHYIFKVDNYKKAFCWPMLIIFFKLSSPYDTQYRTVVNFR